MPFSDGEADALDCQSAELSPFWTSRLIASARDGMSSCLRRQSSIMAIHSGETRIWNGSVFSLTMH